MVRGLPVLNGECAITEYIGFADEIVVSGLPFFVFPAQTPGRVLIRSPLYPLGITTPTSPLSNACNSSTGSVIGGVNGLL